MPIGLPPENRPELADPVGRQDRATEVDLDALDYSDPSAVSSALAAIKGMKQLEAFVSWALVDMPKEDALAAIARTALSERAAIWQRNNPDRQAVEGLVDGIEHPARATLLSLLSPQGLAAVMDQYSTGRYEHLQQGVRFVPNTGCPEVDALLAEVLPHSEAEARLQKWGDVGHVDVQHVQAAIREQATCRESERVDNVDNRQAPKLEGIATTMDLLEPAPRARMDEARFWEGAAAYWEGENQAAQEAMAWGRAAVAWHAIGEFVHAAEAWEQQAAAWERVAWKADGSAPVTTDAWGTAAEAWGKAGLAWRAQGELGPATAALEMEARAWQASGQADRAADAWAQAAAASREAGDEMRAAAALEQEAAVRTPADAVRPSL